MKRIAQFVMSLAVGSLVLYAVLRHFDLRQMMTAIRDGRPGFLVLGVSLMVVGYLIRGARWRIWEPSLSYWDSLRLILIGFMGNNVLPARLGEILRAHCAAAKLNADRGRTAALASIAAERILDGLVLAVFGLVGMALVPLDHRLRLSLFLVSLAFALLASALTFSIHFHEKIRSFIIAANRKFPGHLTKFAREKASHFLDGLLPLGTLPRMAGAIAVSAIIWCIEIGFYYYVGLAVWSGMSWRIALLFLVVVNFASLIPFTIGGIGTIEAVSLAFLTSAGIARYPALAMILLQHAAQYLFTTITGGILYLTGGFYRIPLGRPKVAATPINTTSALSVPSPVIAEARSSLGQLGEVVELKPATRGEIHLSIVIPAYNEQARLPRTVLETIRWCTTENLDFELIIADDGSQDETLALAVLFEESDIRVRTLACPHMGKGATVRMGILNAKGRYILFMDADGATQLSEISKLLGAMKEGYDVAIGSRVVQRPGEVEVKTSPLRRIVGRTFAFFVNLFAIEGIADTQCGFKMFRREPAMAIFSRQKTVGFAFDVEILFIARRLSLSIAEIPVNWVAQAGSKVNLVTDSIRMLWDISHIRWRHRKFQSTLSLAKGQALGKPLETGPGSLDIRS
ncbi:MAG TPA: flippase-like domain-containing protein [Terriglobales bacterium]|jgi:dolichyl-phosphate beta-glucosyltransferase|nr:flippase-like domain-containing protein [Terriglobales bacterium]